MAYSYGRHDAGLLVDLSFQMQKQLRRKGGRAIFRKVLSEISTFKHPRAILKPWLQNLNSSLAFCSSNNNNNNNNSSNRSNTSSSKTPAPTTTEAVATPTGATTTTATTATTTQATTTTTTTQATPAADRKTSEPCIELLSKLRFAFGCCKCANYPVIYRNHPLVGFCEP